jgi:protein involved in polysaccharide export with SLBB domain
MLIAKYLYIRLFYLHKALQPSRPGNPLRLGSYAASLYLTGMILLVSCGEPRITITKEAVQSEDISPLIPTTYLIGQGDELEILYHIDPGFSVAEYIIETEDTLRIDFYYYPVMTRTVRVRPDGFVTLPRVGEVKASGLKPRVLAEKISETFRTFLSRPAVTVEVINFNAKVEELKKAITTQARGQSRLVVVRPDGKISLPYLQDIAAAGLTAFDLSQELEKHYRKFINNISITAAVLRARSNQAYIMGQVNRPNFYELSGPITLTQLISRAGGFAEDANSHQVVVISRKRDGQPDAKVVDMDDIIGKGDSRADPMINQYDVVYVPRTKLAQAALAGASLWRLIPLRFSAGASAVYYLGGSEPD